MALMLRALAVGAAATIAWSFAASRTADQARLPLTAVVPGAVVTQPFGCTTVALEPFDPLCPARHVHTGVDLAAPEGSAVVSATAGIAHVGYDSRGAGLFVAVDFDGTTRLLYCHLFSTEVRAGEVVAAGQAIGAVGESGLATGPHLHFEVQVDGRSVDPARWLVAGS
ncbi:MAG TPA: M23 family metallopeptidase [Candidatus Dormibacteraeota bacterium]|nr:M23 family metallopeptidase [Candidatus Dormibacteraeota bacterium]